MNRRLFISGCCMVLLVISFCRDDHQKPHDSALPGSTTDGKDPFTDTAALSMLFDRLNSLQTEVAAGKKESIHTLLAAAVDTVAGCIYVIGRAVAPQDSVETYPGRIKLMAKRSADQWALFSKARLGGQGIDFKANIKGKILYSRELLQRQTGDTLDILYMVPIGSIVVR